MKKLSTFFILAFVAVFSCVADTATKNYLINEPFTGLTALPSNWSNLAASSSAYGRSGTVAVSGAITVSASAASGNRGSEFKFTSTGTDSVVYVEFDWTITSATVGYKNLLCLYLLGGNSTNVYSSTPSNVYVDGIMGIYVIGNDAKVHCWNQDISYSATTDSIPLIVSGQYPYIRRAGSTVTLTNDSNTTTVTDVAYTTAMTYHISAKLNFLNKKIDYLTIAEKDNETNGQTLTNLPFISSSVNDLSVIGVINSRATSQGNGSTVTFSTTIDNFQVYDYNSSTSSLTNQSLAKTIESVEYYDLAGVRVDETTKGFIIQVTNYSDGSRSVIKQIVK